METKKLLKSLKRRLGGMLCLVMLLGFASSMWADCIKGSFYKNWTTYGFDGTFIIYISAGDYEFLCNTSCDGGTWKGCGQCSQIQDEGSMTLYSGGGNSKFKAKSDNIFVFRHYYENNNHQFQSWKLSMKSVSTGDKGEKYIGDLLSSDGWDYRFVIGNKNWGGCDVVVGNSSSNTTVIAASYEQDYGSDKQVKANIGGVRFNQTGTWYAKGRVTPHISSINTTVYGYTDNTNDNMTAVVRSFNVNTNGAAYWTVKDLTAPTNAMATASSASQINLSWTQNSTHKKVLVVRSTSATAPTPVGGTAYIAGNTIGTGATQGTVVYYGTNQTYNNTGLSENTHYYYYFFSANNDYYASTPATADATTPKACTDPKVNSQTTDAASYCKNASSVTQLSVNASGTNATYKWQQSTTGTSGWSDVSTGTGYTTATFTPSVTTSGTLYYKCIVSACNKTAESNVSGAIKVYGDPTATTGTTVSNITNTTATVSGSSCATGTPASTITGFGIEINNTKYPKTSGNTSSFDVELNGLSANTTYTYKAYVTDDCTTKYGSEQSFTTEAPCTPPTSDGYTLSSTSFTYNGSGQAPTVSPKSGYGTPTTTKYGTDLSSATTTEPNNVGTYHVYITGAASGSYCAYTDLDLGTFTISCPTATAFDVTIDKTEFCDTETATISLSGSQKYFNYRLTKNGSASGDATTGTGSVMNFVGIGTSGTWGVQAEPNVTGCTSQAVTQMTGTHTVTVNVAPSVSASSSNTTAYEVITLTSVSGSVTWSKSDAAAYFVKDNKAVDGDTVVAERVNFKAPAKNSAYTVGATGNGCTSNLNIKIGEPQEDCN